jgi:hypothetical protein
MLFVSPAVTIVIHEGTTTGLIPFIVTITGLGHALAIYGICETVGIVV